MVDFAHSWQAVFALELLGFYFDAGGGEAVNRGFVDDAGTQLKESPVHVAAGEFVVPDDKRDAVGHLPGQCSKNAFAWRHWLYLLKPIIRIKCARQ